MKIKKKITNEMLQKSIEDVDDKVNLWIYRNIEDRKEIGKLKLAINKINKLFKNSWIIKALVFFLTILILKMDWASIENLEYIKLALDIFN